MSVGRSDHVARMSLRTWHLLRVYIRPLIRHIGKKNKLPIYANRLLMCPCVCASVAYLALMTACRDAWVNRHGRMMNSSEGEGRKEACSACLVYSEKLPLI